MKTKVSGTLCHLCIWVRVRKISLFIIVDENGAAENMDENEDQNVETAEEQNENNEIEQTEMKVENGDHSDEPEIVSFSIK